MGDRDGARAHWRAAAEFKGDFQGMSVRSFSETTFFTIRALQRLGERKKARTLSKALLAHARQLASNPAQIDYFATSLPTMLLFEDDLDRRQVFTARLLEAQARFALGQHRPASALLDALLAEDPGSAVAADLRATGSAG
jgi:predicted Zn-dependent protease